MVALQRYRHVPRTKYSTHGSITIDQDGAAVNTVFKLTRAQERALDLLGEGKGKTLLFGGSRSGKTFFFVLCIVVRALRAPGSRHAIFRYRFNSVKRSVWYDTFPAVMETCFPGLSYLPNKSDWFIRFHNGSEFWFGGLDDKERVEKVLGNEYTTMFYNECSEISYDSYTTAQTRLAQKVPGLLNRAFLDCNPPSTSHWTHSLFVRHERPDTGQPLPDANDYIMMKLNPADNVENIADGYIQSILKSLPERQRRRFLDGEWLEDEEGALWNRAMIAKARWLQEVPAMKRIVIAVDPAVTKHAASAETGIIATGLGVDGIYYVLEDGTIRGSPYEWGTEAVEMYKARKADKMIGEVNNGGDLVEANVRNIDPDISFKQVRASRGKIVRAEPIAALYEQGKVRHVGHFPQLEDQLCSYSGEPGERSPDRMDALVWGLTELQGKKKARVGMW